MSRQIAAIMFTSIEGYADLMEHSPQKVSELHERHREIFKSKTEEFHGKVLQFYGGGTLSIFNHTTDAVKCAIQMQLNFRKSPELPVRVGVHLGDISMIGDEIGGEGTNVASSIEALAEPGSIFISKKVFEEIKHHPDFKAVYYGAIPLKNVQRRIGVYALANEGLLVPERPHIKNKARQKNNELGKRVLAAALLLFLATLAYGAWLWYKQQQWRDGLEDSKSIAVLPFVNLSNDPEQEYFSDGMTADLLSQLAKINDLRVVSRTSVMQYKNTDKSLRSIAHELDATHILEGSIMRQNDQVRIAVNLIEAKSDNRIWSVDFDKDIQDVLQVQREVSLEVVKRMKADLTQAEKARVEKTITNNQQAYDFYQRGQNLIRRTQGTVNQLDEAVRLFQQAIELDPNFSLAYVGLADTHLYYATWGRTPPNEAIPEARKAALTAQRLDDELGECYQTLGAISMYEHDYVKAGEYLQLAVEMSPGFGDTYSWIGKLHLIRGNFDEGVRNFRKALDLDPLSSAYHGFIVWAYYLAGQYHMAIEVADEVLKERPTENYVLWNLANVYIEIGDYQKAIEIFQMRSIGTNTNWALGYAYGRAGMHEEARRILEYHLERIQHDYVPAVMVSAIYHGLGETDKALEWLELAFNEGIAPILLPDVIDGPKFRTLNNHPRFQALTAKVKQ